MLKAPGVLLHQGLLTLRGTCDGIAGNGGAKRERGFLPFYFFTLLPLKKAFLPFYPFTFLPLKSAFSLFNNDWLVLRNQCLHDAPAYEVSYTTDAEYNHVGTWLAIEAHEAEG